MLDQDKKNLKNIFGFDNYKNGQQEIIKEVIEGKNILTVMPTGAMCLACNIDFEELAILSNIAGGIVCEKVGVVPITNKELLDRAKKLLDV